MVLCFNRCIYDSRIYINFLNFKSNRQKKSISPNVVENNDIYSSTKGELININKINDPIFSSGIMGEGVAIIPKDDYIYAPCDGEVSLVYKTKHAIGITNSQGVEILIHIGIDTVRLDGKYFEVYVHNKEQISRGQKLAYFNREMIIKENYDPSVLMIITSSKIKYNYQFREEGMVDIDNRVIKIN